MRAADHKSCAPDLRRSGRQVGGRWAAARHPGWARGRRRALRPARPQAAQAPAAARAPPRGPAAPQGRPERGLGCLPAPLTGQGERFPPSRRSPGPGSGPEALLAGSRCSSPHRRAGKCKQARRASTAAVPASAVAGLGAVLGSSSTPTRAGSRLSTCESRRPPRDAGQLRSPRRRRPPALPCWSKSLRKSAMR